ncbi:hypothetical protein NMY22_g1281 [Coprinellus aureogranulatus]|nr:hypothetical protein NMY22_g1281 [Coprinellus aureogranulatus]
MFELPTPTGTDDPQNASTTSRNAPSSVPRSAGAELPTELLRIIFTFAWYAHQDNIASVPHRFQAMLAISHVSRHWREVSLDMPGLWEAIGLTRFPGQKQDITTLWDLLNRKRVFPPHLSIAYLNRHSTLDSDREVIRNESDFWAEALKPKRNHEGSHILRHCKSLTVSGTYDEICAVLKVFIDCNARKPYSCPYGPEWLKVFRTDQGRVNPAAQAVEVCAVSLKITHLISVGVPVASLPAWKLELITLEDVEIETVAFRALITAAGVKKLVLRRITLPAWKTIRPNTLEYAETHEHQTSDTRLESLELDDILDQPPFDRTEESPLDAAFTFFYKDLFFPLALDNLKSLKLVNLCPVAWTSFMSLLRPETGPGIIFREVETLTMLAIPSAHWQVQQMRACLPTNFPRAEFRREN